MPPQQQTDPTTMPPPGADAPVLQGGGDNSGMDRFRNLIHHLSGGGTSAIDQTLQQHYQKRYQDAQLYKNQLKAAFQSYTTAKAGGADANTLNALYQQYETAEANYNKSIGVDKQSKSIAQQTLGLLRHLLGHPQQPQQQQQGAAGSKGARPAMTQPPPGPPQQGAPTAPSATNAATPPPPMDPRFEAGIAPYQAALMESERTHQQAQQDADAASKRKIAEEEAAAKAKREYQLQKPLQPKYDAGRLVGINDPNSGATYVDPDKMPPEARELYDSARAQEKKRDDLKLEDEDRRFHRQLTLQTQAVQNALARSDYVAAQKEVKKAQADYDGAIDRQTTMHQNLEAGLKGDQQAMLSLVANHIGMTLGAQKGARITRAVWDEATSSAPWLQKVGAKFDSRGYLSGVTLTPDQMRQMVDLADQKVDILKDHAGRVKDEYADELSVKRGSKVSKPPGAGDTKRTQRFTDGGRVYNIPANLVDEFKRDHPNATR